MPDAKKKMISKETGTVPKVKYWNNTGAHHETHVANNLTMHPNQERTHSDSRNQQQCANHHCFEGLCVDDTRIFSNYNSLPYINMSGGTTSPSTSGSTSRRHSGGAIRKCDNVTKYPDKKQIEDKLNQIREYLKVTSSLMSSVKEDQTSNDESDELYQMLSALRDSEKKLEALLVNQEVRQVCNNTRQTPNEVEDVDDNEISENGIPTLDTEPMFPTFQNNVQHQRNELEDKLEISELKLHALHEQQSLLMRLQEKAENQLKDARKAQERLSICANTIQYPVQQHPGQQLQQPQQMKLQQPQQIKQQQHPQQIKQQHPQMMVNNSQPELPKITDKNRCIPLTQADLDPDQLGLMHTTNESRGQLLRLLDARDNELCGEQHSLQQKLQELNNKKQHIDQLVSQLHNYGGGGGDNNASEDDEDMTMQIRQIVAMKEQLATLKDMLSAVKSSEAQLLQQNNNERAESVEHGAVIKSGNVTKASSVGLSDTETRSESERRWGTMGKQSNKSSISSSREALQAELQAKKQELEELMYKDQDQTSAINQDVCNEIVMNKGDPPFSLDSVPSSWTFLQDNTPPRESCISRENIYSSDEEELENYSQLNNNTTDATIKPPDYVHCNFAKQIPTRPVMNRNLPMHETPVSPSVSQNPSQPWSGVEHKQQVELMTNLCQSLLDQQRQVIPAHCTPPNFQWYTSYMQMQQALMLSTISQCCQLLWLQQQDINTLINTVSMMQQRPKPPQTINVTPQPPSETIASACSLPTRLPSSNSEYPGFVPRERTSPQNLTRNFPVGMMQQPHQPVWTGSQALNNQVAPGNRANNYWDNFRSYSRQNLLSTATKSNEGSHNSLPLFERSNSGGFAQPISLQRCQQPKINMPIHEGVPTMELNNHEVQYSVDRTSRSERTKSAKRNRAQFRNRNEWSEDAPQVETSPQKSKLFEVLRENVYKEVTLLISANENRPHFLIQLFRDLQMISSDPLRRSALQSIQALITRSLTDTTVSSPSHSTQSNSDERVPAPVPYPVASTSTPSRNKTEKPQTSRCCFPSPNQQIDTVSNGKLDSEAQRIILIEILPFLKSHLEDVFHNGLLDMIKMMIFQLLPTKQTASSNKIQAKLDAMFTEALSKFKGKRIIDIKEPLLQTIVDILLEELPVQTLGKERQQVQSLGKERQQNTTPVANNNHPKPMMTNPTKPIDNVPNLMFLGEHRPFESFQFLQCDPKGHPSYTNVMPRVDNGDLAEADQSRREAEIEEGAVGGLLLNLTEGQLNNVNASLEQNEPQTDLDMFMNQHNK